MFLRRQQFRTIRTSKRATKNKQLQIRHTAAGVAEGPVPIPTHYASRWPPTCNYIYSLTCLHVAVQMTDRARRFARRNRYRHRGDALPKRYGKQKKNKLLATQLIVLFATTSI